MDGRTDGHTRARARTHTHTHTHTHTTNILRHKKKNEILTFLTTWMDPKGIILGEISQRNTNSVCTH